MMTMRKMRRGITAAVNISFTCDYDYDDYGDDSNDDGDGGYDYGNDSNADGNGGYDDCDDDEIIIMMMTMRMMRRGITAAVNISFT